VAVLEFRANGGFEVGTVNAVGITAAGDVTLESLNSGAITISNEIQTTAGGTVTITNAGTLDINANISADGAVIQNGTGSVSFGGTGTRTISTTADDVGFLRAVNLSRALIIDTAGAVPGSGNITFQNTLNGAQNLTLIAGGANVTFAGSVGNVTALETMQITSADAILASSTIAAGSLKQLSGNLTTLTDDVTTSTAAGVDLTATNIRLDGLTINTGAGSGEVRFNGATRLDGVTTITRGSGALTFMSTLNSQASEANGLTINGVGGGDITFAGAVGGATNGELGAILISTAGNVLASSTIDAQSLVQSAGTSTTLSGNVTTTGADGVQIASGTVLIGSGGGITTTLGSDGVVVITTTGGNLTVDGQIDADGDVTINGTGTTILNNDIITSSDIVQFSRPVLITGTGPRLIDTTANPGSGSGGDIRFLSTLDGGGRSLVLSAPSGSGDIRFDGAVTNLGGLSVTGAQSFIAAAPASIAVGSGGVSIVTADALTLNGDIYGSGGGTLTFTNGGLLSINADIFADGALIQNGAGSVSFGGMGLRSITTTADDVNFLRATTLNNPLSISTSGAGAGSGDVTFQSALDGGHNLTVAAGGSDVLFSGAVGSVARLDVIQITSARDITEDGGVTAASLQGTASGITTLNGEIDTNAAGGVNLSSATTAVNGAVSTSNGGTVTFSNTGVLTLNADIAADGALTQTGTGDTVSITGNRSITTSGDSISFAAAVTQSGGNLSIDTTNGGTSLAGGALQFGSTLAGGGNQITLNGGSAGDVTLSAVASGISNFTITNAEDITLATLTTTGAVDITGQGLATLPGAVNAGGPVTLQVNDLDLNGVINAGANAIQIRPATTTRSLTVGAGGAGTLQLSSAELSRLTTSGLLSIGGATHAGSITLNGAIANPTGATGGLTFINNTGGIVVNAPITYTSGAGNLTFTANGAGATAGAIVTSGGLITTNNLALNAGSGIGTLNNPMQVATGTIISANNQQAAPAGDISIATLSAGDITLAGLTNAAPGGAIKVETQDGVINTGTLAVNSQGSVNLIAKAAGALSGNTAKIVVGTGGIVASGQVLLRAADDLTINGAIASGGGDILIMAGNSAGMNHIDNTGLQKAAAPVAIAGGICAVGNTGGCIYAASEASADASGSVEINAQVNAGTGDIVIVSSGSVTQPATGNTGLINSGAGSLVVRTFNDVPGSGVINLTNGTAGGNQNGLGGVTLETRLASDEDYSAAHPGDYAASDIDYKSVGGLVIKGVGTAANYVGIASTQNIDLNALNIQARNLTLIANNGDVLVNTQIKNSNINNGNAGGSLSLYASNDIKVNWVPGTNDVSIGEATSIALDGTRKTVPFNHDLRLTAANNIDIQGAIYLKGNLVLRADAALDEATMVGAPMALGAGTGGVNISYNPLATQPLEVKATNILVGGASGGEIFPVNFLNLDASTGAAAVASGNMTVRKDVQLIAENAIAIHLGGSGGPGISRLTLTGGNAQATTLAPGQVAKASAIAGLEAQSIKVLGESDFGANDSSVIFQGGNAHGDNSAGGGAVAIANAISLGIQKNDTDIGSDLKLAGGQTSRTGSATVSAGAEIDPDTLTIVTGGNVILEGGQGVNTAAKIVNRGNITMRIGGSSTYSYTHSVTGAGITGPGLILLGISSGSGLFNGQNLELDGMALPIEITFTGGGGISRIADANRSAAYIQTGVYLFDTSLLNYLIFAANEETRTARVRAGLGAGDESDLPACN